MRRRGLLQRIAGQYLLIHVIRSRQLLTARMKRHQHFPELAGTQQSAMEAAFWGLHADTLSQSIIPTIRPLLSSLPLEKIGVEDEESGGIVMDNAPAVTTTPVIEEQPPALPILPARSAPQPLIATQREAPISGAVTAPEEPAEEASTTINDSPVEPPGTQEAARLSSIDVPPAPQASEKMALPEEAHTSRASEPPMKPASPTRNEAMRRPRSRIEERPASPAPTSSAPASQLTSEKRQRGQEQRTGRTDRLQSGAAREESVEADALFQPRETDRSPQAWLARLRGEKSPSSAPQQVSTEPTVVRSEQVISASSISAIEHPTRMALRGQGEQTTAALSSPTTGAQSPFRQKPTTERPASSDLDSRSTSAIRNAVDEKEPMDEQAGLRQVAAIHASNLDEEGNAQREALPLSQRIRRFLQPLVGIDPAAVPVYRDTRAERATDAFRADALTVGNQIELGAQHMEDTPQTLGVLAHELTHVARQREPRFVPPVARSTSVSAGHGAEEPFAPTDEEALAGLVEGRVRHLARQGQADMKARPANEPAEVEFGNSQSDARREKDPWGGLPAPWEPLPVSWLAAPTTLRREARSGAAEAASPLTMPVMRPGGDMVGNGQAGGTQTGPTVQRAGIERSMPEEQEDTSTAHDAPKAPEPDLDALARQVYAILKRRLGVEYRRES